MRQCSFSIYFSQNHTKKMENSEGRNFFKAPPPELNLQKTLLPKAHSIIKLKARTDTLGSQDFIHPASILKSYATFIMHQ